MVAVALCVAATVVAAVAWPVAAVAQEAPSARGIDQVCPPPDDVLAALGDSLTDFPDVGETHGDAIVCAAQYEIVAGFADGTVRPGRSVTRGQLASLLTRWVQTAIGFSLPVPDERSFSDVGESTHADAIEALADVGILGGREDGTFGPGEPLTRGQLAATVAAAISFADVLATGGPLPPDDSEVIFTDTGDSVFDGQIRALAGIGVVQGTGGGAYSPDATVTRGQLATFLMRAADYLDRQQRWQPTADMVVMLVRLEADEVVADGTADADPPDEQATDPAPAGSATVVLTVNAFNGTIAYTIDIAELTGPFAGTDGATLHLGVAGESGPVVLQLASGAVLDAAEDRVATDVVRESASVVRFADMIVAPEELYVQIATEEAPAGAVRGQLRIIASVADAT